MRHGHWIRSLIPSASCRTEELYDRIFQTTKPAPLTKLFFALVRCRNGCKVSQNLKNTNDLKFAYSRFMLSTKVSWAEKKALVIIQERCLVSRL